MTYRTEIAGKAGFEGIRYAQCWEDADVLLAAARVGTNDTCLSVASAGDNTLALVGAGARRVIAADLSPAQIACLELRVAAYRTLAHDQFLRLLGQNDCIDRMSLYRACREQLSEAARQFWDKQPDTVSYGIAQRGRFEKFLTVFRRLVLPVTQRRRTIHQLFNLQTQEARQALYDAHWNTRRWRLMCYLFFGRASLGRFGRHPSFTEFADESVWNGLQRRLPRALVEQNPNENPYLQWILRGRYETALPWSWREENFTRIRDNLQSLQWSCDPIEAVLDDIPDGTLNHCNMSDIFEYMSGPAYETLLRQLVRASAPGCRVVYWNVVVKRSRPEFLAPMLTPLRALADELHGKDKVFFYRDLIIEEVTP